MGGIHISSFRQIAPIVLREGSLLVLWLLTTPIIGNYIAVNRIFQPLWFSGLFIGHLIRWGSLYYGWRLPPRLSWVYHAAFLPIGLLWGFILGGELRVMNPVYPVAILLFGGLVGYLHGRQHLRGWMVSALLGLLLCASLYYQLFALVAIYAGLLALFALGGVFVKRTVYQVPTWVVALATMNLVVVLGLFHFRFVNGAYLDHVSQDPAVERLFVFDAVDPVAQVVGKNVMSVQEACEPDTYLVSSHHGEAGLVLVDHKTRVAQAHPSIKESSNDVLVDCLKHEVVAGEFNRPGGLYIIDLASWPDLSQPMIPISGHGVVYILFDPTNEQYLVFPKARVLYTVDARTGHVTSALPGPDEPAYDPRTNELTTLTEPDFSIMRLKIVDRTRSASKAFFEVQERRSLQVPLYKRLQMYFHPGPADGTTLVTSVWDGTVTLYDRTLKPIRQTRVAPGINGIVLTPDKQYLLICGYADGYFYVMNLDTWKVVRRLYLGHRMRELRLSRDGRYVYVGTSQGGFRIDLTLLLGPPPATAQG